MLIVGLGACASSTGGTTDRVDRSVDAASPAVDAGPPRDAGRVDASAPRPDGSAECAVTRCGSRCVDTSTDPSNCGGCGRSCVVTHASAACAGGACTLGDCAIGWLDCDGDVVNGCETADGCVAGAPCETSCGSTGSAACADACAPSCAPPAESCNLADDDCDGQCDQGAIPGCRVGVHRAQGEGSHFYSTDLAEASSAPFTLERADFFFLYANNVPGTLAFYRCLKANGRRFYTTSSTCEGGGSSEGILGHLAPSAICGATALYRLYRDGSHFYTTSAGERDNAVTNLGWRYESIAGYVWTSR